MDPLPRCSYRFPYDSTRFFCSHAGVISDDSLVTSPICRVCRMYQVTCSTPRPAGHLPGRIDGQSSSLETPRPNGVSPPTGAGARDTTTTPHPDIATAAAHSTVAAPRPALSDTSVRECNDSRNFQNDNNTTAITEVKAGINAGTISIIVPTWNCGAFLRASLESLIRQTIPAPVIVVDDGSTDETAAILSDFADRIQVFVQPVRHGANAARNIAIRASQSPFIAFADADNEYEPTWLKSLCLAHETGRYGVAYSGFTRQAIDGSVRTMQPGEWAPAKLWWQNEIDMSSVIRRDALPPNGLPEGFRPFDDWQLWLSMAARGWSGINVAATLFRKHERLDGKTSQSRMDPDSLAADIARVRRTYAALAGFDTIAVVIPGCGCEDLTMRCLSHLGRYSGIPLTVYYVDNGSPDAAALARIAACAENEGLDFLIIRNAANRGFTHAINQGIKAARDQNVLLLNNDCFIGPECIERMAYHLASEAQVAAVGPLTGDNGHQSLRRGERLAHASADTAILQHLDEPVSCASLLGRAHRSREERMLAFFCTLLSREAISALGTLNPTFSSGLMADDDWCRRAKQSSWKMLLALDAYATHLHSSTFERLGFDRRRMHSEALSAFNNRINN